MGTEHPALLRATTLQWAGQLTLHVAMIALPDMRRNQKGQFKHSVDVGRSLAADRRSEAKTKVKPVERTRLRIKLCGIRKIVGLCRGGPLAGDRRCCR